jgi:hypothetical protein
MARDSNSQKETIGRVMDEFKHGELESHGEIVRNPKQAIAIGLSEAGATNRKSPSQNRRALTHAKSRERNGQSATDERGATHADLYRQATERGIAGRSRMTKADLEAALRRH